jgi:pentapeptide repeat protein
MTYTKAELDAILAEHKLWLTGEGGKRANLTGANLTRANLRSANLSGAGLTGARLSEANLTRANLRSANLSGAGLTGADLSRADLTGANLSRADLRGAGLSRADLSEANLTGADLSEANLRGATMPAFPLVEKPTTLREAAAATRDWLKGRWIKGGWIETPKGYASGECKACLHGAAVYIGGEFGPELSRRLDAEGHNMDWNDAPDRTEAEVLAALDEIAGRR